METIISSIPFGGLAMILLSIYRLVAIAVRFKSPQYAKDLTRLLLEKILGFFNKEYKLISIFGFSLLVQACINHIYPTHYFVWYLPIVTGIVANFLALGITNWVRSYWLYKIESNQPLYDLLNLITEGKGLANVLSVLFYLFSIVFLLANYHVQNVSGLLFLFSGFSIGSCGLLFFILMTNPEEYDEQYENNEENMVTTTRFDILVLFIIILLFTTITFTKESSVLMLPVLLTIFSIIFSVITKWLGARSIYFRSYRLISTLMISGVSLVLVQTLLPEYWMFNGREYYRLDVLYVMLAGIWGSWISGKTLWFYWTINTVFRKQLTKKTYLTIWLTKVFKFISQSFTYIILVSLLFSVCGFSFVCVGIYGVFIAYLAMFSHLNAKLTTETSS